MIDQDLLAYLVALDTDAGERVYLGNAPQNAAVPFVVVRRTGGSQPRVLGRALFQRSEFSVNVITDNYAEAYPTSTAILNALKDFRGTMETTSIESSRCLLFPTDQSEIEGDKVTRWVALGFLFMHS